MLAFHLVTACICIPEGGVPFPWRLGRNIPSFLFAIGTRSKLHSTYQKSKCPIQRLANLSQIAT